ncbi:class I tRNA ligase family protein, partial [Patescibacteria group bacterium]|nr:class I tRNA ligase family protein [Patescibacteria group bacterium]
MANFSQKTLKKMVKCAIVGLDMVKKTNREKFYNLVMLPYSSGNLHIGHWYNFAPADIYSRYKKMQGNQVFAP